MRRLEGKLKLELELKHKYKHEGQIKIQKSVYELIKAKIFIFFTYTLTHPVDFWPYPILAI